MEQERSKKVTREYFDSTAKDYDSSHDGRFVRCMYQEIVERAEKLSRKGIRIERVLDLGCGNGNVIAALREKIPVEYYGLDLSEKMVEEAGCRLGDEIDLRVGDAEHMPYEDRMFDLIICNASFHHYPHPKRALEEMRRVLRPGGVLILGDPTLRIGVLAKIFNCFIKYSNSGDAYIWRRKEITRLFGDKGFKVKEWKYVNKKAFVFHAVKE